MSRPLVIAFIYDFDGTMLPGNTMDHRLLPDLGYAGDRIAEFWQESNAWAKSRSADRVCAFMQLLAQLARKRDRPLTAEALRGYGRDLPLHPGLVGKNNWFDRTNQLCAKHGLQAEHYIVSSGLGEIIDGCPVAKHCRKVFASRYTYDADGHATWPAWTINYTTKTQCLFRINKGVLDECDDVGLNRYMAPADRPVPFEQMVFIGDGYTDIPCFRLVKERQGHSLAVLSGLGVENLQAFEALVSDNRVDSVSLVNHFEPDSRMDGDIKKIVRRASDQP